jgi:glyoxylase-like metal-dependent hydrolase (beta-lactamase superfamily II)
MSRAAMSRTTAVRCAAGGLFLLGAWVAFTQNQAKQPPELKLNKITNDLYEIEGDGGNVAVYITNEGVIMVDDKYEQDYDQIMSKVKSVTNQPIRYILSTHYHADHSGGNTRFAGAAEIISTLNAHNNIVNKVQSNAPPDMVPARVTFTQETDVFLGGKHVQARYYGRGHTNGDAVIYFPALRVVHTGDLVTVAQKGAPPTTPLIDYPGGGSLVDWTKTLDEVMKLDFDTVIPGHGPVSKKADILAFRNNTVKMRNRAQGLIRQGKSQDDVAKVMMTEYNWMPGSLYMQWSLPGMMKELK